MQRLGDGGGFRGGVEPGGIRLSHPDAAGRDILAACGQLKSESVEERASARYRKARMTPPTLETPRGRLRPLALRDAEALFAAFSDRRNHDLLVGAAASIDHGDRSRYRLVA
jgi:hypothetical protein